jgi:hypothetical protein
MTKLMHDVSTHLKANGFSVGEINTGFVALDDDGIVFLVSKYRTSVQARHPESGKYNIESRRLIPSIEWFDEQIARLTAWTQDPVGKEPLKNSKKTQ